MSGVRIALTTTLVSIAFIAALGQEAAPPAPTVGIGDWELVPVGVTEGGVGGLEKVAHSYLLDRVTATLYYVRNDESVVVELPGTASSALRSRRARFVPMGITEGGLSGGRKVVHAYIVDNVTGDCWYVKNDSVAPVLTEAERREKRAR